MKKLLFAFILLSASALLAPAQTTCVNCGGGVAAITDNGTVVTSTEPIVLPLGAINTPALTFTGATSTTGMFKTGAQIRFTLDGSSAQLVLASGAGFGVAVTGGLGIGSPGGTPTVLLTPVTTGSLLMGQPASATPAANTFQIGENSRGGTDSNVAGASGTLKPGIGTGLGAGTKLCIQRDIMGATGSTAQNTIDGYCVGPSKTLSNTSATAQSLANISVPSNSAGGVFGTITVTCTDGTNFDSETQSFNVSYVNKATVLTVGTPAITTSTAANNSGSCTAGITAVAGTNSVDIKVTPAFTTIVPTIVTSYIELANHGTGNVTFN